MYSYCHSLSEQMTPAANFAAAFWQLTVLWCWHWLRDISLPVHFTPLITISVTLLLSQYQVSLKGGSMTANRQTYKDQETVQQMERCSVWCCYSEKQMFMTHFWLLTEDTMNWRVYDHWIHNNFVQILSDSIIILLTAIAFQFQDTINLITYLL